MSIDRRDLLKGAAAVAAGTAIAGMASSAIAEEAAPEPAPAPYAEWNKYMRDTIRMDCDCIGVKFYENIEDVPEYAVSPMGDMGVHMSACQAFSLARYNKKTIVMTAKDEWCWAPLVGFGMVDCSQGTEAFDVVSKFIGMKDPEQGIRFYAEDYPRLPLYKYAAWVVGPLSTIDYVPDVTLVYGDPFAINWCGLIAKYLKGNVVSSRHDGIDSCCYEMHDTMVEDDYKITFPDCGEIVRARTKFTDAVFSIPASKLEEYMEASQTYMGYNFEIQFEYPVDYSRPPFYNQVFEMWGLDTGPEWELSQKG